MTTATKSPHDIVLTHWTENASAAQMRMAFRSKYSWVVDAPRSPALWYAVVLNNLACNYVLPDTATVDSVRTALSNGLSRTAFDRLRFVVDISSEQLGRTIGVPQRTLSRREKKFKPDESERLLRVASAFQRALGVLGSIDKARRWFVAPKRALGGKAPLDYCDTEPGAEAVEHLLGRIEQGVFT